MGQDQSTPEVQENRGPVKKPKSTGVPISMALLQQRDDVTSRMVIDTLKDTDAFSMWAALEGTAIERRDAEDNDKLALGIQLAIRKGVLPAKPPGGEYRDIDVVGKSASLVADEIIAILGDAVEQGCVVVLVGLSGTGKGTTMANLSNKIARASTWSNGNVFRSLTLLANAHCATSGKELEDELTAENLSAWVSMLSFEQVASNPAPKFDIRIKGLGMDYFVSEIANTVLKSADLAKNIPTVAAVSQGEVVRFAAEAIEQMTSSGVNVLLEGREQTVDYVPSKFRFRLILTDGALIGMRRAAQKLVGLTLERLDWSDASDKSTKEVMMKCLAELADQAMRNAEKDKLQAEEQSPSVADKEGAGKHAEEQPPSVADNKEGAGKQAEEQSPSVADNKEGAGKQAEAEHVSPDPIQTPVKTVPAPTSASPTRRASNITAEELKDPAMNGRVQRAARRARKPKNGTSQRRESQAFLLSVARAVERELPKLLWPQEWSNPLALWDNSDSNSAQVVWTISATERSAAAAACALNVLVSLANELEILSSYRHVPEVEGGDVVLPDMSVTGAIAHGRSLALEGLGSLLCAGASIVVPEIFSVAVMALLSGARKDKDPVVRLTAAKALARAIMQGPHAFVDYLRIGGTLGILDIFTGGGGPGSRRLAALALASFEPAGVERSRAIAKALDEGQDVSEPKAALVTDGGTEVWLASGDVKSLKFEAECRGDVLAFELDFDGDVSYQVNFIAEETTEETVVMKFTFLPVDAAPYRALFVAPTKGVFSVHLHHGGGFLAAGKRLVYRGTVVGLSS